MSARRCARATPQLWAPKQLEVPAHPYHAQPLLNCMAPPNQRLQLTAPAEQWKRRFVPWRYAVYSEAPSPGAASRRS